MSKNDISSLSHSKWRCQYHIVFAPKFRRKVIYNQIRVDIGKILRKLCDIKGVEIIEAELCPDHVHMLVSIPPSIAETRSGEGSRHLLQAFASSLKSELVRSVAPL